MARKSSVKSKRKSRVETLVYPTPKDIYSAIDSKVVGQHEAKQAVSVAVTNHIIRVTNPGMVEGKNNLLIIGPTGTGKTEIARTMAKFTGAPMVIVDSSHYTPSGYIGEPISNAIKQLVDTYGPELAERGIIVFDEFDKLVDSQNDSNKFRNVAVQSEALKMVEGADIYISDPEGGYVINTSNILFIFAGAFTALSKESDKKALPMGLNGNGRMPIKTQADGIKERLVGFGMMPELIGRISRVVFTEALKEEDLVTILKSEGSIIDGYKFIFNSHESEIVFKEELLGHIARESIGSGLGVRGMKSLLDARLEGTLFDIDKYKGCGVVFGLNGVESVVEIPKVIRVDFKQKRARKKASRAKSGKKIARAA